MQHHWFDDFTQSFHSRWPRRTALGLAAGIATTTLLAQRHAARAGCKKVGKKCDKNKDCCDGARCGGGKCKCKSGYNKCNKKCYDLDKDEQHCGDCATACGAEETCCSGTCADLQNDVNNCGSCGRACEATMECIVGVCVYPPGTCLHGLAACETSGVIACGESFDCRCYRSTEGEIVCGNAATPEHHCGECASSADCASYGAEAFCIETGTRFCGCGTSAQNYCGIPCDI